MKSTVFGVILVRIFPHSNRIRTRITAWYWIYFQKLCLYCLIEYYFRKTVVTFLTCSQSNSYYIIQDLVHFIKRHSSNPDVHSVVIPWKLSKYGVISGPYFTVFSPNAEKYGPEITPYLDTFHAVHLASQNYFLIFELLHLLHIASSDIRSGNIVERTILLLWHGIQHWAELWLSCKSVFNPAQVLVSSSCMDPWIFSFSSEQFPLILSKEQFFVAGEHRPSVYHS